MNISSDKKQSGFTLVEIAIVLVIIGLLLGGILKGQELINSARVRNLADQNAGIQAAYYGFIDRYRQVPGDWDAVDAQTAIGSSVGIGGNGNGRIDDTLPEAAAVWTHLAAANFLGGGFTPAQADPGDEDTYIADNNSPVNAFNGALLLSRNDAYTGNNSVRLNLHMGDNIPVAIARELDVKVDDSRPTSGILRLTGNPGGVFSEIQGLGSTCDDGSNEYDIVSDGQDCGLVFLY